MSKQSQENRKIRARPGLRPTARRPLSSAVGGGRIPIAFARQLAAAQRPAITSSPSRLQALSARLIRCSFIQSIQRLAKRLFKRRSRRRKLDIVELQQLGEKRFVAILRVGKQRFLIAGAAASVSLLAEIDTRRATSVAPRPLGQERA